MTLTQLAPPYPIFTDTNGDPLDAGYLYFGEVNQNPETNPIQIYYDSAFTIPAAQPLRTSNGYVMRNGSPAAVYANNYFSVTVRNKRHELVIYAPSGYGITPGTSVSSTDQMTYNEGSAGAVDRALTSRLQDYVSVKDFGAVGDGVTDDYSAFSDALTAASGRTLFVPNPSVSYRIGTGTLTIPANTAIVGETPKVTRLDHAFSGTMFVMGDGASLVNLYLNGDGANYSGKCMDFQGSSGRQTVACVRASDWQDEIIYFSVDAGSQSSVYDCRFERRNAGTGTNRFAVVVDPTQKLLAVPRKFSLIDTGGTCAFDFGGCNNVYVSDSFLADLKYTADSRAVLLSNCRIANMLSLTVYGNFNTMSGCDISPQITLGAGTDAWNFDGSIFNNLPVIDNSGNNRNIVSHYPITYTPILTSGGTAPSLGNGTLVGYASRNGTTVNVNIVFTIGSTTTLGTGDLRFSLPTWAPNTNGYVQVCGTALINDSGTYYIGVCQIPNNAQYVRIFRDTSGVVTATSPATFTAGDVIYINAEYEV